MDVKRSYTIPFNINVSFAFTKDNELYELSVKLLKGEEMSAVVEHICRESGVPSFLKKKMESVVHNSIQNEIKNRSRKYVVDLFARNDFKTEEKKELEFYKIFHQVFSIKTIRLKLTRLEKELNSIFNEKIQDRFSNLSVNNFLEMKPRIMNEIERIKTKQKLEYRNMIQEVYQKKEPIENILNIAEEEYGDDDSDTDSDDENDVDLRNPKKSITHGLSILYKRNYQRFEIFTNEDILNSYTYYTQKTISVFVVFVNENMGNLLCSFDPSFDIPQRLHNLTNLFQNRLSVLLTTFTPVYEHRKMVNFHWGNWMREVLFASQISSAPELHFEDFNVQKKRIITEIDERKLYPLQPGEHFITKHSNLNHIHMIYHLKSFSGDEQNENDRFEYRKGLSDIFYKCCFSDANDVFVKLPFFHSPTQSSTSRTNTIVPTGEEDEEEDQVCFEEFEVMMNCFQEGFMKDEKFKKTEKVILNNFFIFVPQRLEGNEKFRSHIKRIVREKFKVKTNKKNSPGKN